MIIKKKGSRFFLVYLILPALLFSSPGLVPGAAAKTINFSASSDTASFLGGLSAADWFTSEKPVVGDMMGTNLIPNAQMESTSYWGGGPTRALIEGPFGNVVYAHESVESGTACYAWAQTARIPVDQNKTYKFSIWIKALTADESNYFGYHTYNAAGTQLSSNPYFRSGSTANEWTLYEAILGPSYSTNCNTALTNGTDFCMESGTASVIMRFGSCYGNGNNTGKTYYAYPVIQEVNPESLGTSGNYYVGGNVGIGKVTPAAKLDLSGTFRSTSLAGSGNVTVMADNAGTLWTADMWSLNGANIYRSSGNVSIGTTVAGSRLDVHAPDNSETLKLSYGPSPSNYYLKVRQNIPTGGVVVWNFDMANNGTIYNNTLVFDRGNIGIGTTNPGSRLHIYGGESGNAYGSVRISGTAGGIFRFASSTDQYGFLSGYPSGDKLSLYDYGTAGGTGIRMIWNENGNVGINTDSPGQKLDVNGYTKATGFCIGTSCITSWPTAGADTVIGNEVTNATNATLARSGSGTAAAPYTLALNLGNANTWTAAQTFSGGASFPSGIWNTSGNVGIGTTNPTAKLHVVGTTGLISTGSTQLSSLGGAGAVFVMADNSGNLYTATESGRYLTAKTETSAIDVNALGDNFLLYGGSTSLWLNRGPSGHNGGAILHIPTHSGGYYSDLWFDTANNRLYSRAVNATSIGSWTLYPKVSTATANYLSKWASPDALANSVIYDNGTNVGIGTTGPGGKLEVYGGNLKVNGGDILFSMTAGQTATRLVSYSNASGLWLVQPTAQSLILADNIDWDRSMAIQYTAGTTGAVSGRLVIGQTSKNSATYTHGITSFYTNGAEQLRINSSGNVGIGITDPKAKLHISGTADNAIIVDERDWNNKAMIFFREGGGTTYGGYVGYNAAIDGLQFNTLDNGTEKLGMFIARSSGNVGVGTNAPGQKLHVVGNSYATGNGMFAGLAFHGGSGITTNGLDRLNLVAGSYTYIPYGVFYVGGRSHFRGGIDNDQDTYLTVAGGTSGVTYFSGAVGIGNTAPSYTLDVSGSMRATGDIYANAFLYNSSDRRLKENIKPLTRSLSKIQALEGVSFDWKKTGRSSLGLIAQDVELIYPELVSVDKEGYKAIAYEGLIAPLIEAVKAQQLEIENLEARLEKLEARVGQ